MHIYKYLYIYSSQSISDKHCLHIKSSNYMYVFIISTVVTNYKNDNGWPILHAKIILFYGDNELVAGPT